MDAKQTLEAIKKEKQKARKALMESQQRCQELIWAMEEEGLYGQAKKDNDEAIKITQTLKCAEMIIK